MFEGDVFVFIRQVEANSTIFQMDILTVDAQCIGKRWSMVPYQTERTKAAVDFSPCRCRGSESGAIHLDRAYLQHIDDCVRRNPILFIAGPKNLSQVSVYQRLKSYTLLPGKSRKLTDTSGIS
ncbi:hypothetical protein AWL63_23985 (plasmid) [Sphingomonas panacis]|uniref:Uncharacterized protein n=1 Tax=Sphingomonas panacis TaxID=1560345 RepID=A0A1B3ZIG7_9SPHN|nr:hypothetical protein AWL63_23985 [Sphingomonas panacis]